MTRVLVIFDLNKGAIFNLDDIRSIKFRHIGENDYELIIKDSDNQKHESFIDKSDLLSLIDEFDSIMCRNRL